MYAYLLLFCTPLLEKSRTFNTHTRDYMTMGCFAVGQMTARLLQLQSVSEGITARPYLSSPTNNAEKTLRKTWEYIMFRASRGRGVHVIGGPGVWYPDPRARLGQEPRFFLYVSSLVQSFSENLHHGYRRLIAACWCWYLLCNIINSDYCCCCL